jgi:heat shock protein HslJ
MRRKMKILPSLFGIVVILLIPLSAAGAAVINLVGTEWSFPDDVGKTARFIQFRSEGKVGGFTGCNRFTGSYSQDGDALSIGPLATTRRACLPEVMKREQQFLAMLGMVRHVEGTQLKLTLKGADADVLAELVRTDPD